MGLRVALFAVILVAVAGIAGLGLVAFRPPPTPPPAPIQAAPPPAPQVGVLVAGRAIQAGSLLKLEDLSTRIIPPWDRPEDALLDTDAVRTEMRGALVRRPLSPGELLRADDVLRPRDRGFLAAVLGRGMRAMSVGVDAVTGAAGLIWPGDRVDLILTQAFDEQTAPVATRVVSETALADVRVIAVDQAMVQGADGATTSEGRLVRTVTLEVTPVQAETVAVASRLGRLALSVRAMDMPAEQDDATLTRSTFSSDVSPALRQSGASRPSVATVRVHAGTRTEEVQVR